MGPWPSITINIYCSPIWISLTQSLIYYHSSSSGKTYLAVECCWVNPSSRQDMFGELGKELDEALAEGAAEAPDGKRGRGRGRAGRGRRGGRGTAAKSSAPAIPTCLTCGQDIDDEIPINPSKGANTCYHSKCWNAKRAYDASAKTEEDRLQRCELKCHPTYPFPLEPSIRSTLADWLNQEVAHCLRGGCWVCVHGRPFLRGATIWWAHVQVVGHVDTI